MTNVCLLHNGWRREVETVNGDVLSTADPTTLLAVIVLYSSSVHVSEFNVTRNNIYAVKAIKSKIKMSGDVTVSNNRAITGAAFILDNSILNLIKNAHIQVINNHATNTGGAFHITGDLHYCVFFALGQVYSRKYIFLEYRRKQIPKQVYICEQFSRKGRRYTVWRTCVLWFGCRLELSTEL